MIHPDFDAYTKDLNELIAYDETAIADFHLYAFEWIDNLHFLRSPESIIADDGLRKRIQRAVEQRFIDAGWEETGQMSLLWLPSFVFPYDMRIPHEGILIWLSSTRAKPNRAYHS